jgi:hypothetical protein
VLADEQFDFLQDLVKGIQDPTEADEVVKKARKPRKKKEVVAKEEGAAVKQETAE